MKKLINYLYLQEIGHYWKGASLFVVSCTTQQEKDISILAVCLKKDAFKIVFL
jgi:hypothetical protein